MKLSTLVDQRLVKAGLAARTRDAALSELLTLPGARRLPVARDELLRLLADRERAGSTGLGAGVALPHCRCEGLTRPVLLVGTSGGGLDFDSPDGAPVRLVLLLLSPISEPGLHLQALAGLAALAQSPETVARLTAARSDAELTHLLRSEQTDHFGYAALPLAEMALELGSTPRGLADDEARRRLAQYGPNRLHQLRRRSQLRELLANFTNLFALLLWGGALLAWLAGMPEVAWAMVAVILFNGLFSFWQEHRAEQALAALSVLLPRQARVVRDGEEQLIPAEQLVPGDLVVLEEGDAISADARLVESAGLRVDNSVFSGESRPGYKNAEPLPGHARDFVWTEIPNLLFAGTTVVSGTGRALVFATGMATELGKVAYLTQSIGEAASPLQREIGRLSRVIVAVAAAVGLAFLAAGTLLTDLGFAAAAVFALGMIVANVPEGLLPTVTLSLAVAVQRMARRNVLVKRLSAVETLGATTVICSDKTGTLTTNQISVAQVWIDGRDYEVTGTSWEPKGELRRAGATSMELDPKADAELGLLLRTATLCNTARLLPPGEGRPSWSVAGDPTEGALLSLARKAGLDPDAERDALPPVHRLPFDSVRKRMSSVHRLPDGTLRAFVKGAPRELLALSTRLQKSGGAVGLGEQERAQIAAELERAATRGLRLLGFAWRDLPETEARASSETIERELTFVGFAAMHDPPRPGVAEAIARCRRAGIRVLMITGDYGATAEAVARSIGLVTGETARIVTGEELRSASDEALKAALSGGEVLFARASPEHKLRIVGLLQAMGETVAVTGDGVNDAPALRRADIGVAMGLRGSDVARESAEMILTDDDFSSIVAAVEEGRAVFANLRKFITYVFAHLVPEAIPFVFYALLGIPVPLTVLQILAIDLGTETLPALALGVERPEPGVMEAPPRSRHEHLVDTEVLARGYGFLGLLNAAGVMAAYFFVLLRGGWSFGGQLEPAATVFADPLHLRAMTTAFCAIVTMQIANLFACRSADRSVFETGLFGNRLLWWGLGFEVAFMLALVYLPPLQGIFSTAPIGWQEWALLAALSALVFFAEEARKWWRRRSPRAAPARG